MIPTDDTGTTAVLCKPRASGDDPDYAGAYCQMIW